MKELRGMIGVAALVAMLAGGLVTMAWADGESAAETSPTADKPAGGRNASDKPVERVGPLKDLPGAEGAHLAKIRAMGNNTWLELGPPAADPKWGVGIGRAWCGKMAFAPDLRGAFLYGEGRHGGSTERNGKRHYNDDLFFYDINGHRWVCVYPGMELGKYDLGVNDDGFEVDAAGHPVPVACFVHCYNMITYDSDRRMFVHLWSPSGYWRNSMPERVAMIEKNSERLNGLGRGWSAIDQAGPWMYDTAAGHWRRYKTKAQTPRLGHGSHLIYLPGEKKYFCLSSGGLNFYDPADNDWHAVKAEGPHPPRPIDAASCYDPKRNRVYVAMGSYGGPKDQPGVDNRVFAYDVARNLWIDLQAKGDLPPRPKPVSGCGVSKLHYDSANDVVLYFSLGEDIKGSRDTSGIYAYSADANEWKKVTGKWPENWPPGGAHCFYDPKLNAHFLYKARDSSPQGTMFVYRYKQASAGEAKAGE